jgi:hypothetical protein
MGSANSFFHALFEDVQNSRRVLSGTLGSGHLRSNRPDMVSGPVLAIPIYALCHPVRMTLAGRNKARSCGRVNGLNHEPQCDPTIFKAETTLHVDTHVEGLSF